MNKKTYVTKGRIAEVAKFLLDSIEWLKEQDCGCCHYNLDDDFALYVGWQSGYDVNDPDIIASPTNQTKCGGVQGIPEWTEGYAIVAGVKLRNDYDCSDYEFLDFPCYGDGVEVCDYSESPLFDTMNVERMAKWYLECYVEMTNMLAKGKIKK